jgi:hypothetical protein
MGFSRERARQVERDALATLRRPQIRARLQDLPDPGIAPATGRKPRRRWRDDRLQLAGTA